MLSLHTMPALPSSNVLAINPVRGELAMYGHLSYNQDMATARAMKNGRVKQASERRRSARLETRLTKSQKELIERAAAYQGRTVTDFVVNALASAAEAVVQEHEVIRLNQAQSLAFVQSLLDPPGPNSAMRRAARKYGRTVESR